MNPTSADPERASAVTVDQVTAFIAENLPFVTEMNIVCDSVAYGQTVMRFEHNERWIRPGGIVSGPVLMTLADVAIYIGIATMVGFVPMAVTNELKTNFLRPAQNQDLLARGTILKLGRKVAYGSIDLYEPSDPSRMIGHATGSYVMPDPNHT